MKTLLVGLLIWFAVLNPTPVKADDTDAVHFAAHFGLSFAIDAFTYGVVKQAFHLEPTEAWVFATFTTLMIGFIYKFSELQPGPAGAYGVSTIPRAMLENAAGCAAFGVTVSLFKF